MSIISFIDDKETIKKILVHLGLWETRNHDPLPRKVDMQYIQDLPEIKETVYDDFSQLTPSGNLSLSSCHIMQTKVANG